MSEQEELEENIVIIEDDEIAALNSKEDSLIYGAPGQILTTDGTGMTYEWNTLPQPTWGGIAGTLANQTDLQAELDLKANQAALDITNANVATNLSNINNKIQEDTYATATTGGTIKMRLDGNDLYLTNDGTNP